MKVRDRRRPMGNAARHRQATPVKGRSPRLHPADRACDDAMGSFTLEYPAAQQGRSRADGDETLRHRGTTTEMCR